MTELAVIGSSHVGAVRQSATRIGAAWPDVDIRFFALPGAPFRRAGRDPDGVFRARPETPAEADLVARINGATGIDLAPFDRIWVIGHRYGLGRILRLYLKFDVLERSRTGHERTVSGGFADAATDAEVGASCDRIAAQFGPDPRIVCTPAPYPALRVRADGPYHEPAIAHMLKHPDRDAVLTDFEARIASALADRGYGYLPQPAATRAAPFATKNTYLRDARDFRDTAKKTADLRHMNAEYGFQLFRAYAETWLSAATPPDETVEERT